MNKKEVEHKNELKKNKDIRTNTLRVAQKNVIDPYKKSTPEYPDYIGRCTKCNSKTTMGRMPRWDNVVAEGWVNDPNFLTRYDEWHGKLVCDECYNLMLEGCKLDREGRRSISNSKMRRIMG